MGLQFFNTILLIALLFVGFIYLYFLFHELCRAGDPYVVCYNL